MDNSIYIAMSGAKQTLLAQTSNANNLANSQTTGFKNDLEQFRSQPVFGEGYPTRVYAMTERPGTDFSSGAMQTTGRDLDIAINGDGYIAVNSPDGNEAYTRAGDLRVTPEGLLLNGQGMQIVGQNGPIAIPPAEKLTIGTDGTITIIPMGSNNATATQVVDRIKLVKPQEGGLEKRNDGLFHVKEGVQPLEADANVTVASGALEASNVNTVSALVDMIELSKNFELQTKFMKNADENAAASAKLMQLA